MSSAELCAAIEDAERGLRAAYPQYLHLLREVETRGVGVTFGYAWSGSLGKASGYHPGLIGPFSMYEFPAAPPIVFLEHRRSSVFLFEAKDVAVYQAAVTTLNERANGHQQSVDLIYEIAADMETDRKSSYGGENENCVEAAETSDVIRDSKNPGEVLPLSRSAVAALVSSVRRRTS